MRVPVLACAAFLFMSADVLAAKPKILATCSLGSNSRQSVTLLAGEPIGATYSIHVQLGRNGAQVPLFGDDDKEDSRTGSVTIRCAGDKEKVLVVHGEFFDSNYPRGVAIRYHDGRLQRLHFAEHAFPSRVYLDGGDMQLYIPQPYPGREPAWIVYRYNAARDEAVESSARTLPAGQRYVEIELR